jgi:hypothetical protein
MSNKRQRISALLPMTLPSETMYVEDKRPYSPRETVSPTCIPQSSSPMVLSSDLCQLEKETPQLEELADPKSATSSTAPLGAHTVHVATAMPVETAGKKGMGRVSARSTRIEDVGIEPKYLRYNLWNADASALFTTAEWSETAVPLPRPPPHVFLDPITSHTLKSRPDLFTIQTPVRIDVFESLLSKHPNQPFVRSVCCGLREGFWPWADTFQADYPPSHEERPKGQYDDTHLEFFRDQLQLEQKMGRYSETVGPELLPGMYAMPIYAVPKPNSLKLRLVNDHSAGPFSLNSMIDHSKVTGYPLDGVHLLGASLLQKHADHPGEEFILWKSDIANAYRLCPMHPTWQIKQGINIDGQYYIDRANCFGSSASFAIFISFNSLVTWIAKHERGVGSLFTYVDDTTGATLSADLDFYDPYQMLCPAPQAAILRLWDELGIPHARPKQLCGSVLPITGIEVDPNAMTFSLSPQSLERLINEFQVWIAASPARFRLRQWQGLAGWINWTLNVYPLLRPCLNNFYPKIAGKSDRGKRIWVNQPVRDDFVWALQKLQDLPSLHLLKSIAWSPAEASITAYCDASPYGLGFWFPLSKLGYYASAPPNVPTDGIFYLEALCVLNALQLACRCSASGGRILLYTDNLNSVDIFSTLSCLPVYNEILRASVDIRISARTDVRVLHVRGEDNEVADALSRLDLERALLLEPDLIASPFAVWQPLPSRETQPPPSPARLRGEQK